LCSLYRDYKLHYQLSDNTYLLYFDRHSGDVYLCNSGIGTIYKHNMALWVVFVFSGELQMVLL